MSWYSTGSIQVAVNGTVATGTGTQFLGNVRIGDGISIEGSAALHEVTGVTSDTQLTFQPPYAGAAGSGLAYRVAPVLGYDKELSDGFNQIRLQWGTTLSSIQPWSTAPTPAAARTELGAGTMGNELFAVNTTQEAIQALGLGTSSALNVTASSTDTTDDHVMRTGDGGWMGDIPANVSDMDDRTLRGWRYVTSESQGTRPDGIQFGHLLTYGNVNDSVSQEFCEITGGAGVTGRRYYRQVYGSGSWGPWRGSATTSNTVKSGAGTLVSAPNAIWADAGSLTDAQLSANSVYAGALEIREVNLVTNTKGANADYAPGLTFHWGGYVVSKLWMNQAAQLFWGGSEIWHRGSLVKQTFNGDATAGSVLLVGAGGLLDQAMTKVSTAQVEAVRGSEFFKAAGADPYANLAIAGMHIQYSSSYAVQFVGSIETNRYFARTYSNGSWMTAAELWHSGNLTVGTSGNAIGKLSAANTWGAKQVIVATGGALTLRAPNSTDNSSFIEVQDYQGSRIAYVGKGTAGDNNLYAIATNQAIFGSGSTTRWAIGATGTLYPLTDNSYPFGSASARSTQLFAATATIGTSDAREKTPVRELIDAELDAAIALADEFGAYQWLHAIDEKGNWARDHIGMTVQRAIEVMEAHGLEPFNYGFICYDQWPDEFVEHPAEHEQIEVPAVLDDDGNELEPARVEQGELISEAWTELVRAAGDRYSFRGEELQAFILAGIRARQRRLEERLKAIENAISQ